MKTTNQNSFTLLIYIWIELESEELREEADVDKMHSNGVNSNKTYVAIVYAGVVCMVAQIKPWMGRTETTS